MAGEGLRRRTFLGAAAAAGVGAVAGTTAGCDAGSAASARAAVGGTRRASPAAVPERDLPGDADFWVRPGWSR